MVETKWTFFCNVIMQLMAVLWICWNARILSDYREFKHLLILSSKCLLGFFFRYLTQIISYYNNITSLWGFWSLRLNKWNEEVKFYYRKFNNFSWSVMF